MRSLSRFAVMALLAASMAAGGAPARGQADTEQIDIGTVDEAAVVVPPELSLRVRLTAIEPAEPASIQWRHGGEGMGGDVIKGAVPKQQDDGEKGPAADGGTAGAADGFAIGEWSAPIPLASLRKPPWPDRLFVTFWASRLPQPRQPRVRGGPRPEAPVRPQSLRGMAVEFEISHRGRPLETFTEHSPDGSSVGLVVWPARWAGQDDPDYAAGVMGLLEYASLRADAVERLPWAKGRLPTRFSLVTDLNGYGEAAGYGIHHGNRAIIEAEARTLRQLGVNGLRSPPAFLADLTRKREGIGAMFSRSTILQVGGYPVVPKPRVKSDDLAAGCPFEPHVPELTKAAVEKALTIMRSAATPEVWGLTVDEIGVVFDNTNDGKDHVEKCPRCRAEFAKRLEARGLVPGDFGKGGWADVTPFVASSKDPDFSWMQKPGLPLTAYHTRLFMAEASAGLFTPLRQTMAAASRLRSVPGSWATYALRGNTFLLGGHSLDFFDFYRQSDNGFVYETSNRDPRIHQWDSYLCDVGRMVTADQGLAFGVYVKPHRGAVVQRAVTAIGRGATMLFWYTYGPDYSKGDCFSSSPAKLELTSKAAHLIGAAEDALHKARWVEPARIGIVRPRTSEIWLAILQKDPVWSASWENAKWVWSALAHEHLPVDPLDEEMLEHRDLSAYRVLYVHGPNLRRTAAAKLAEWVERGGVLYTSGWSLTRDEANRPLEGLLPVLGLESRSDAEMYLAVKCYGAGGLEPFLTADGKPGPLAEPPPAAAVSGQPPFEAAFRPQVGREVLRPAAGTEVVARFADGSAAITCHPYGRGRAYVVGFFPGLEYSAAVRTERYDMASQFDAGLRRLVAAPALEAVEPVVDTKVPTVEGLLLENPGGDRCIALVNWTYRAEAMRVKGQGKAQRKTPIPSLVEQKDLRIAVRGAGPVAGVRSVMLDAALAFEQDGERLLVTVPRLEEADVLLLAPATPSPRSQTP